MSSRTSKRRSKGKSGPQKFSWPTVDLGQLGWGGVSLVLCLVAFQAKGWFARSDTRLDPSEVQFNFGHSTRFSSPFATKPPLVTDAPYAAAVSISSGVGQDLLCTGTLVSPAWVLTSAKCVESRTVSSLFVVIGTSDLERLQDAVMFPVKEVVVHPKAKGADEPEFDLALLHLHGKDTKHTPIKLDGGKCAPLTASASLKVVGWGLASQKGGISPRLRAVNDVKLISPSQCYEKLPMSNVLQAPEPMCTSPSALATTADYKHKVEVGSPLVTNHRQVGVVSESFSNTNLHLPVLYAKVSSARGWIQSYSGASFTCDRSQPGVISQLVQLWVVLLLLILGAACTLECLFRPRNRPAQHVRGRR